MEEALVSLMLADAGLAAVVADRIDWSRAPQGRAARPYIVLRRIGGQPQYHMEGPSGLTQSRVQVDAYGADYASAAAARRAAQALLSGYAGTHGGVTFQGAFIDGIRDLENERDAGDVRHLFATSFDLILWHD